MIIAVLMNTESNSLEQDICPLISDYLMIFLNSFQHKRTREIFSIHHKIILLVCLLLSVTMFSTAQCYILQHKKGVF